MRKRTRKKIKTIHRMLQSGASRAEIAEHLGIGKSRVSQIVRIGVEAGLLPPEAWRPIPRQQPPLSAEIVRQAFRDCKSVTVCARRLRVHPDDLREQFAEVIAAVDLEQRRAKRAQSQAEAIAAYDQVVQTLGRKPATNELPPSVRRAIRRGFRTLRNFAEFCAARSIE